MTDPIIPISAEFGEPDKIQAVPISKPLRETEGLDAFKKEMEKKAVTVNEKEREDNKADANMEHQIDEIKPLIQEAITQIRSKDGSILDTEKPTTTTTKEPTVQSSEAPSKKSTIITNDSDASMDSSSKDDGFAAKLKEAPISTSKEKVEVEHVAKKMAPPPLSTPVKEVGDTPHVEKKTHTPVQMETSAQQGDTSSKQKPSQTLPSEIKTVPQETSKKPDITVEPLKKEIPQELPPPAKTPISENPTPKPLVTTHSPPPKISAPAPTPLLTQELPPQNKKEAHFTPVPQENQAPPPVENIRAAPLEKEPEILTDKPVAQPLEAPIINPLELAQTATDSTSSPVVLPFPIDTRRKDDVKSPKEEMKERDEQRSVEAPPESDSLQKEKKDEEEKQKQATSTQNILNSALPDVSSGSEVPFDQAVGFDRLSPHVLDLFDRLVGVITVLQIQGKTETTIFLNEQQSPLLQGTEIVITTFDTASKSYNIDLRGPPQAVALLQKNVEQLKKSFKSRKEEFKFDVNEITISLKEDKKK